MVSISLCMIVRDEERDLPRCLQSVIGIVDEICIVDTGSTDRTIEIAREHRARVESFEWCDDYSAARNASLAMASGDWVLVLDADEAIEDMDARALLEAFAGTCPDYAAQLVIVDRQAEGDLRSGVSRFFPNRDDLHYEGRFHEQPCFGDEFAPPLRLPLEVIHTGYTKEALARKDKVARNCAFIERLIEEEPDQPYHHFQLGRTLMVGGDNRAALEAFTDALDTVEPDAPYLALLTELTCHCLRSEKRSEEAFELIQQVAGAWPDRSDMVYIVGLLALDTGRLELAESCLQRCLTLDEAKGKGGSTAASTRTWGPAYHLAVLREGLGMLDDAREWYERALEFWPQHAESHHGLERVTAASAQR